MPRQYPSEFRRRVVELARSGVAVTKLVADYDVPMQTIYRWIDQDKIDHGEKPGLTSAGHAELLAARRRIRELEQDLEVVRKAAAIFDEQNDIRPKDSTR